MSSVHADLFAVAARRHDQLLEVLTDLEAVARAHSDDGLPRDALPLLSAIWPFLKAYGRRDEHGSVDEEIALHPRDML